MWHQAWQVSSLRGYVNREKGTKKVSDVIETHSKMWEKLRVFNNEVWLEVQGQFIQDHQDIDSVTREGLSSDQETSANYLKEYKKEVEVKPMY